MTTANSEPQVFDDYMVHVTHCCVSACKYLDDDCPVATRKVLPQYRCEDCTCLEMNPGADAKAEKWWASLSPSAKATLYLQNL